MKKKPVTTGSKPRKRQSKPVANQINQNQTLDSGWVWVEIGWRVRDGGRDGGRESIEAITWTRNSRTSAERVVACCAELCGVSCTTWPCPATKKNKQNQRDNKKKKPPQPVPFSWLDSHHHRIHQYRNKLVKLNKKKVWRAWKNLVKTHKNLVKKNH